MNALTCTPDPPEKETSVSLSRNIAAQIESLRQERLRAYADQVFASGAARYSTRLERDVDALLDSLHTLHRLEQLADYAACGGQITVEADRLFIAENIEIYRELLSQRVQPNNMALLSTALLPRYPKPLG
jgi:hypothetical protein